MSASHPTSEPIDGSIDDPPPDAGEPQGAGDSDRPPMLGTSFAKTILAGSLVGVALAIAAHFLITNTIYDSQSANNWSWVLAVIGGFAVGGACSLFIYGAATDRSDTDEHPPHGRADVTEQGEWRRTVARRRRGRSMRG
jgi:hypothetical protein